MFVPKRHVMSSVINDSATLEGIQLWIDFQKPPLDRTMHWWINDLPNAVKKMAKKVSCSPEILNMFRKIHGSSIVHPIHAMDEIYVSNPHKSLTSDAVFYSQHIDGPFFFFPFCSVYRMVVAVNENRQVETVFPCEGLHSTLSKGDIVAFDFNRTIHYIRDRDEQNEFPRSTLKLHFLVCPRILAPLGAVLALLTTLYDRLARKLFNITKKPRTILQKVGAAGVIASTLYEQTVEQLVGRINLYATLLAFNIMESDTFFYATQYIHYAVYIMTYREILLGRSDSVDFYNFKRNAIVFKALSLSQLLFKFYDQVPDALSVGLVLAGFLLSGLASIRIGSGAELRACPVKWVNYIPHPMLVGTLLAFSAIHNTIRNDHPHVIPIHFILSLTHLLQEVQIHSSGFPTHLGILYLANLWMMCSASLPLVVTSFTLYSIASVREALMSNF